MGDNSLIIRISGTAKEFVDELEKVKKKTKELEKALSKTAKASSIAFAAFASVLAFTTKQFIDYEKALVGVGKTTNIQGKALQDFGKKFQKLSQEIPVTTNELLGIAQAAGQLGISGEKNLLKFTETIAKLGVATDLTGEQAAVSLARLLGLTKESVESIDVLGSVIVALGNSSKASESEIVKMALAVGKSTTVFGLSSAQAAAYGTVLKELGQEAQLSGSVVGKSFLKIQKAIDAGGAPLARLSELTGIAGADLKQTFQDDASSVFRAFLSGIGNLEGGTTAIFAALEQFGLKGDEVNKILPVLAQNTDLLNKAFNTTNKELENATALNIEAAAAFNTLGSEGTKTLNTLTNIAVEIGQELAPTIKEILIDVRDFAKAIRETDGNLIANVATFIKWGAIISGAVASIALFLLGALKISAFITTLTAVFLPATVAASAFWIALTGPIGIAVAGLVAVGAGVAFLAKSLGGSGKPETLVQINKELEKLEKTRERIAKGNIKSGIVDKSALKAIDDEISKLEELRQAKLKSGKDFGTGALLVRPELESGIDLGAGNFGIEETASPQIPLAPASDNQVEEVKKVEAGKSKVIDEATQKRIDKLKSTNAELLAIEKARGSVETEEEKDLAQKKAEIDFKFAEAKKIANVEERNFALENLRLQNAEELAEIDKKQQAITDQKLERAEERKVIDEILREEEVANRELLDEEDLIALEEKLLNEDEVKKNIALEEALRVTEDKNKFLADELVFGERFAKINQFFRNKDLQGAQAGAQQLIQLTQSKNDTLASIGKAAASVNAAIATGEGAIKAYSSLAGIPIVGPALGAAAAGALIAFGVEQQAQILGANEGGRVPTRFGTAGVDSVPAMLTPNELIAPDESFDEVVEGTAVARGFTPPEDEGENFGGGKKITVELVPTGDFINIIQQKNVEAEVQNTGV